MIKPDWNIVAALIFAVVVVWGFKYWKRKASK